MRRRFPLALVAFAMAASIGTHAAASASAAGAQDPARDAARPESRTRERRAAQQDVLSTHGADGIEVRRSVRAPMGWQVGVPFDLRLEATAPEGVRVAFPSLGDSWGPLEVRAQRAQPASDGGPATFDASLVAWDAGAAELPAIAVQAVLADGAVRTIEVPATTVEVGTSLEADTPLTELPADIRGAVEIGDGRWWWWAGALVLAGAALAGVWWLRGRAAEAEPELAPHERARLELDRLELERLPERGEVEPFYVRLSDIVRAYVEGRFGIAAPDRTTQEFLREAARDPRLAGEHERELAGFLRAADMVKFAEARPDPGSCGRSLESMRSFVERTAPAPEGAAP